MHQVYLGSLEIITTFLTYFYQKETDITIQRYTKCKDLHLGNLYSFYAIVQKKKKLRNKCTGKQLAKLFVGEEYQLKLRNVYYKQTQILSAHIFNIKIILH